MKDGISASRGLAGWLRDNRLSLVGSYPEGAAAISRCAFDRAMGLAARGGAQDSAAGEYIVAGRTGRYQPRARDAIKATREKIRRLANRRAAQHRWTHPWCGVTIVEFAGGNIVEWRGFHGPQTELLDVVAIAEIFCPSAAAPRSAEADGMLTFGPLPVLAVRAFGEMT